MYPQQEQNFWRQGVSPSRREASDLQNQTRRPSARIITEVGGSEVRSQHQTLTCQRDPQGDLVLYHHVGRHGRAAGRLELLGAALLLRLAGVHIVGVVQTNVGVHSAVLPWPELGGGPA